MRALRNAIERGLPLLGVALVLIAVVAFTNLYIQLAVVLIGLLLIEAGIWNLASPILPSERRFMALRSEVDDFIGLVRRLNEATLEMVSDPSPPSRARVLQVRDEMLDSVRRMERYAGRTDEELAAGSVDPHDGADSAGEIDPAEKADPAEEAPRF